MIISAIPDDWDGPGKIVRLPTRAKMKADLRGYVGSSCLQSLMVLFSSEN